MSIPLHTATLPGIQYPMQERSDPMASQGSVIARVYTSDAYLPLRGAPVVFTQTDADGNRQLLAIRTTNSSGLTAPLFVSTPDLSQSQSPGSTLLPYATVDIGVSFPGYSSINALGVQIFPGVETIQGLQLQPVSMDERNETVTVPGSSQNL